MNDKTAKTLELPSEGGSYTRLPDGTLARNDDGSLKRNVQPHEVSADAPPSAPTTSDESSNTAAAAVAASRRTRHVE